MNKILLGIFLLVVLTGAVFLLNNRATTSAPSSTQTEQVVSPTQIMAEPEKAAQEARVTLTDAGFSPKTLTVKARAKVVWINQSGSAATVDSAVHPTHLVYLPLNLGEFNNGESLELVFDKPGTYRYHDHLNPSRSGMVVVEE